MLLARRIVLRAALRFPLIHPSPPFALEAALTCARGMNGLEQLNLVVGEHNTEARRLYESFGFNSFGIEPRELKVDDQYYNGVHMWLKLP